MNNDTFKKHHFESPYHEPQWYVMRDLKRWNAKQPAYQMLQEMGITFFTPMVEKVVTRQGKRVRLEVPYMQDLLFVRETRRTLDPLVEKIPTFQYRFLRGTNREPMTVSNEDMERFIKAVKSSRKPQYFQPGEITADMYGKHIRIIGGPLDGYEGQLLSVRGSRIKRIIVELPQYLSVAVEVHPQYIQLI